MFSIYIKEGNDSAPQSSILFGGYDEEAFLDQKMSQNSK